ncbi:hypothetical protein LC608_35820 [Nostoc sp. XA010]|uniref:hypothetical protein n=1 Tax=Nostoc sp. XA010 TaxID=2780407 RepID=UPI001E565C0A|nr:hypothetical protein [Nostoc sp. XA010]MCC5662183.1 hypothetical protein [Nostoc sp. XA010]
MNKLPSRRKKATSAASVESKPASDSAKLDSGTVMPILEVEIENQIKTSNFFIFLNYSLIFAISEYSLVLH